jgi:hypothetical protein
MAILPSRPGIKISIVCNGAALQEYNDDEEEPNNNIVSKYIEAISGAEFGIHWKLTPPWPPYTVLLEYRLDQKYVAGTYCKLVHFKHPSYSGLDEGVTTTTNGQYFLHKFAFAALAIGNYLTPWM